MLSMISIHFQTIKWNTIPKTEHPGETGTSFWQTLDFPGLRLRMVEYSAGYFANHWCQKGHIVHCIEGSFTSELDTGEKFKLAAGESYIVSDDLSSHRSISGEGVKLLIIDGDFLKTNK
jgi:mannose-6-phosphate isomerase class I